MLLFIFTLLGDLADGQKLYEDLFGSTEVSILVSLVSDIRIYGKKG